MVSIWYVEMTKQQIKQAAIAIWRMRQPAFIHRQRQIEARREIEFRRIETALWAAIREDMSGELDALKEAC